MGPMSKDIFLGRIDENLSVSKSNRLDVRIFLVFLR